ncbi:phenylalanine--tRNA ligase subunit beta [Anaerovorax odorimutans]|uniref:Phenylalanine--tRNA ligase beta subunit n=1 Tax=Anaerovorax odorimutans TaxID=109327 RepID=A0ABT1RPR4_9FIRM|nr:phenylalanine--tRNA ligase subunit beta [Anaerovorax odorimutans]MCQ4637184.1 phenylalanine--tRNA ligase subunit beta [Anaerovorax odorimutans]
MLVPIEWLKDYTDIDIDTKEFCDRMIMSGSNLETCEYFCEEMENVVVGRIEKIEKHPDADKLVVCMINVGRDEPVQIVTGAPNVFEGAYVPVALHKSRIPGPLHGKEKEEGGTKITKGKLRGVESFGMLCSAGELGFDDKVVPVAHKDGIWILEEEYPLGQDFAEALGLKQAVVDFEITPNRPDCLSMVGMAREAAATFGGSLNYPDTACVSETDKQAKDFIQVEIKEPELCRRYAARIVTDVKIGQSPWWLQKRLMYAGMRPINNIVDITNFVMLEFGQPIHAFDIRQIADNKIVVERAAEGETFTTLDNTERTLTEDMLLIKDGQRGVAIAGVMGGLNSEIEADTTTILVESANFNGDSVRATSKKLGLRTEASSRFEKGIDPNLCQAAADRVCRLIEILGCGKVASGTVDVYPKEFTAPVIDVRVSRINSVLGTDLSREEMVSIFESLEMKVEGNGEVMKVTPPTIRQDLLTEVDFVEEVARMYGYDKLPVTIPKGNSEAGKSKERTLVDLARDTLCALGANEVQTYSFVSPRGVDDVRIDEDSWERAFVKITNPLGEENSVMRTILTPNMLEVLARNYSRNIESVRAFEIGSTFMENIIDPEKLPDEQTGLCIGMYGKDTDFFTLKGMVTEMLKILGVKEVTFTAESEYGVYHPGRCARISVGDEELGIMGEIYPDVAEKFGIGTRAYVCELFFDSVIRRADIEKAYQPLPKYPATSRDIALLVDEEIQVGDIESIIKEQGKTILEKVQLFDVYRGKQVAEGKKSVAFALTYRDKNKTLTDEDVAKVHDKVLEALKEKVNAVLREI